MKIIKSGKTKKPKENITTCRDCGCKFSFLKSEAKYWSDPRNDTAYVVNCPECKIDNWLAVELVN